LSVTLITSGFSRESIWAKGWFRVGLKDVGKYKVKTPADIDDELRKAVAKAYQIAEKYLQRGK